MHSAERTRAVERHNLARLGPTFGRTAASKVLQYTVCSR